MNRGLWFVAGAGAGIYGMLRARRAAEAFTPDGLADRLGAASVGLRMLREEVTQGAAEKEVALRARIGERERELRALTAATEPPHDPDTDAGTGIATAHQEGTD